jgi:hypothetical protein
MYAFGRRKTLKIALIDQCNPLMVSNMHTSIGKILLENGE